MLMAGLDGINARSTPASRSTSNLYELPPEQLAKIPTVPTSLDEALDELEADHAFLLQGGVFTDDLIEHLHLVPARAVRHRLKIARTRTSSRCTSTGTRSGPARSLDM